MAQQLLSIEESPLSATLRVTGDPNRLDLKTRRARSTWPVALVNMPFASTAWPSIQLGLLKSIVNSHGFPVKTCYPNLELAQRIGPSLYQRLAQFRSHFFGDWLFSLEAFAADAPDLDDRLLEQFGPQVDDLLAGSDIKRERLRAIRHEVVPLYLDHLIDTIAWNRFRVVGFTSTFEQSVAAFALAKRIKARFPDIIVVFGGANFDGEMGLELVRAIPSIDYAIIGEGDLAFPEFLLAQQEGREPASVPGVVCRRNGTVTELKSRPPFHPMDDLPVPDYSEFFEQSEALGLLPAAERREVPLPFESARGCWWGQKQHCTFCGLNTLGMAFRAKSPERVVSEIDELRQRYRSLQLYAVDNILDAGYLKSLLPLLIASRFDGELFYEVKSNLSREQLKLLREAGVLRIQPGIESLSTQVLKLMRKGVTAIHNVNTLRWARYYDINVGWNLLWGFPGETDDDYRQQAAIIPRLAHLQPPGGGGRIWMERFSPVFSDRTSFPVRYIRPEASYSYVYPEYVDLDRVAYFFDYEFEDRLSDQVYEEIRNRVDAWKRAWQSDSRPTLTFWAADGLLQIEDLRDRTRPGTYTFSDPLAAIYLACSDRPLSARGVGDHVGLEWPVDEIESALGEFCTRDLMLQDANSFLSLALPATRRR